MVNATLNVGTGEANAAIGGTLVDADSCRNDCSRCYSPAQTTTESEAPPEKDREGYTYTTGVTVAAVTVFFGIPRKELQKAVAEAPRRLSSARTLALSPMAVQSATKATEEKRNRIREKCIMSLMMVRDDRDMPEKEEGVQALSSRTGIYFPLLWSWFFCFFRVFSAVPARLSTSADNHDE